MDIIYLAPEIGTVMEEWHDGVEMNGWEIESIIFPGDTNQDGKVDGLDFIHFRNDWGKIPI